MVLVVGEMLMYKPYQVCACHFLSCLSTLVIRIREMSHVESAYCTSILVLLWSATSSSTGGMSCQQHHCHLVYRLNSVLISWQIVVTVPLRLHVIMIVHVVAYKAFWFLSPWWLANVSMKSVRLGSCRGNCLILSIQWSLLWYLLGLIGRAWALWIHGFQYRWKTPCPTGTRPHHVRPHLKALFH